MLSTVVRPYVIIALGPTICRRFTIKFKDDKFNSDATTGTASFSLSCPSAAVMLLKLKFFNYERTSAELKTLTFRQVVSLEVCG